MKQIIQSVVFAVLVGSPALALAGDHHQDDWDTELARSNFTDPARNFEAVKTELLQHYIRSDISEAELYRAAVQGMLAKVDPKLAPYQELLSPSQEAEMQLMMKGELVGIGVQIDFEKDTGIVDVNGVIPGSPAEKADVRAGDKILSVDGLSFKGKDMMDVVQSIRGKEGDPVRLEVLRDAAVLTKTMRRQRVPVSPVSHQRFPGQVEVLTLHAFSEKTPAELTNALTEIARSNPKGLVVDLRSNEGGLLEQALDSAKLFLPRGTTIAKIAHRGNRVETVTNDRDPVLPPVPTVILVTDHTMSSAELIAAALRAGLHAPMMGTRTKGKWSVQSLKELPNHFVIRYTVAMFQAPDGQSYEGTGMVPDVEVTMDPKAIDRAMQIKDPEARLAADNQLRAAVNLLRMRP